jgi:small GTP-binding protein
MSGADSVKVVLLGEAGVGKTSIIHQFTYHTFDPDCISSISAQFVSKTIDYQGYGAIKYDIWDTAGQERYRSMAKIFYKDAKVIVFVYDITSQPTFDGLKNYWYEQIKINCESDAILAVVANKNDLYADQVVSDETGQKFADEIGAIFQSTSALSDSGIGKLFDHIGRKYIDTEYDYRDIDKKQKDKYEKKIKKQNDKNDNDDKKVKLGDTNNENKGGCCS